MDKEKFLSSGLIDLYVLGLASEKDAEIVQKFAEANPEIKSMIDSLNVSLEQYAIANSVPPPQALREKTLTEVDKVITQSSNGNGGTNTYSAVQKSGKPSKFITAIGVITILGLGFGMFHFNNKLDKSNLEVSSLKNQLADCQENTKQIETNNQIFALQNGFLKNNKTAHVHLRGTPNAPTALAVAYWNEEEDFAYLNILDLPKPNSDKQYQLWADVEGEMINMGTLDFEKEKLIKIPHIANAESLNITLEKLGGAKSPDVTQIFISGKV